MSVELSGNGFVRFWLRLVALEERVEKYLGDDDENLRLRLLALESDRDLLLETVKMLTDRLKYLESRPASRFRIQPPEPLAPPPPTKGLR